MSQDKVLIVDDEKLVRWSLRQKCEEWGYQTVEAENGQTALKVAHNESPDLVLLDVRLPDIGGLEVLQQLKQNGDARAVIMITADPQLDDVKAALKLGAYDFVGKPIDFDELAVTTKNALETTKLKSEVEAAARPGAAQDGLSRGHRRLQEDDRADGLRAQGRLQRSHHHPDAGRKRHRQGPDRQGDPLRERAAREAVRRHQLLGDSGDADGSRAVRPRARRLHRRQADEEGPVRSGRRRHAVPGRDRRALAAAAGQAAARAGRPGDPARRRRSRTCRWTCA